MGRRQMNIHISLYALVAVLLFASLMEGRRANRRIDKIEEEERLRKNIMMKDMLDDLEYWANNDHPSGEDW
jgi:hypothetical protein